MDQTQIGQSSPGHRIHWGSLGSRELMNNPAIDGPDGLVTTVIGLQWFTCSDAAPTVPTLAACLFRLTRIGTLNASIGVFPLRLAKLWADSTRGLGMLTNQIRVASQCRSQDKADLWRKGGRTFPTVHLREFDRRLHQRCISHKHIQAIEVKACKLGAVTESVKHLLETY
ncbi:hypothetical protein C8J57DRAFT_1221590 [Mycena rebaudengoi]|nr:hypothetical protein C8J57DRAFT_1221590 [Mycena rebaudengoi]